MYPIKFPALTPLVSSPMDRSRVVGTMYRCRRMLRGILPVVVLLLTLVSCSANSIVATTPTPTPNKALPQFSIHEVSNTVSLPSGGGFVTATCPDGENALGGGWTVADVGDRVVAAEVNLGGIASSYDNAYTIHVFLGSAKDPSVTAYVECLAGVVGATVYDITVEKPVLSLANVSFTPLQCRSGDVLVGVEFGFVPSATIEVTSTTIVDSQPPRGGNLEFGVKNLDTVTRDVNFSALCLGGVLPAPSTGIRPAYITFSATYPFAYEEGGAIKGDRIGNAFPTCPPNSFVAGGGYSYVVPSQDGGRGNVITQHAGETQWQESLVELPDDASDSGIIDFVGTAICLTAAYSFSTPIARP